MKNDKKNIIYIIVAIGLLNGWLGLLKARMSGLVKKKTQLLQNLLSPPFPHFLPPAKKPMTLLFFNDLKWTDLDGLNVCL